MPDSESASNEEVLTSSEQGNPRLDMPTLKEIGTKPLTEEIKNQLKKWISDILNPCLIIIRVTVIFILAILADNLIIIVIDWSFGSIVKDNPFAAKLLVGIQLLSALGTSVAYILYLIRALQRDIKETRDAVKEDKRKNS